VSIDSPPVGYRATGKRKTSVARVVLVPGDGPVICNGRPIEEFFGRRALVTEALKPLVVTGMTGRFGLRARLSGGGVSGQAGALSHGIARALVEADETLRAELKREGLLTRDARIKERKKAGLKGARKRPQFSKR
jgi:small subunit ribosomal protein S9